jgi:phosphoribosyl-ATP pyrophosphohydrolase/phosphoribosyl-AMP cyclohydrolase
MLTNLFASFKDDEQLLPAIVQDANSKEVLMLAWINKEALERTASTKQATFWSRSRKEIWVKGQTSGNKQEVISIKFDCDSDAFLFLVHSHGPACHTGEKSCFHSEIIL